MNATSRCSELLIRAGKIQRMTELLITVWVSKPREGTTSISVWSPSCFLSWCRSKTVLTSTLVVIHWPPTKVPVWSVPAMLCGPSVRDSLVYQSLWYCFLCMLTWRKAEYQLLCSLGYKALLDSWLEVDSRLIVLTDWTNSEIWWIPKTKKLRPILKYFRCARLAINIGLTAFVARLWMWTNDRSV